MKTLLYSTSFIAWFLASAACQAAELGRTEAVAILEKVAANYECIEARNYQAAIKCPALDTFAQTKLAAILPMPWLPEWNLINSNGQHIIHLNLEMFPKELRELIQAKVRSLGYDFFTIMRKLTGREFDGLLKTAAHSARLDIIQFDDRSLDCEINEINASLAVASNIIQACRIKINRLTNTAERFTYIMADNKYLTVNLHHTPHVFTDTKQTVHLVTQVDIDQTAFQWDHQGLSQKFTIFFEDYRFSPMRP